MFTCAISGEQSPGKHYILKTTEGEETVCPEALFHNGADRRMVSLLVELQAEVKKLKEHVFGLEETPAPAPAADQETPEETPAPEVAAG